MTSASLAAGAASGARPAWVAGAGAYVAIVAAALFLWAPTLMIDVGRGDSLDYNLVWISQFSPLVAHGHLYPRWLPASFGGLGSPAFEFYPPLPFWVTAAVSAVSGGSASVLMQLKLAALAGLAASGVTMRLWLMRVCAPPRALVCALIYMAAPYHLMDHYIRGAFAEFFAIAFIPLVALGLAETHRGARAGPAILAVGYALVVFSHLPVALLTSVMLIAPYGLWLLWSAKGRRFAFAIRAGLGLAAGLALSAIYLAPALMLQPWVSADYLWTLQPAEHAFTSPAAWAQPFQPVLAGISSIEAAFAVLLGWRAWQARDRWSLAWAALALAAFLLLSGLVPGVWSIPLMAKVQFPWRAISVEEFALVTAVAVSRWPVTRGLALLSAVLAIANPGLTADLRNLARGAPDDQRVSADYVEHLLTTSTDAAEYLPHGMLQIVGGLPQPRVPLARLATLPLAAGALSATSDPSTGAVRLRPPPAGGRVVLRRFYFPSWRVMCDGRAVASASTGPARLVGFAAPPGAAACEAAPAATPAEGLGRALSLAAALGLAGYALWPRRRPILRRDDASALPAAGSAL